MLKLCFCKELHVGALLRENNVEQDNVGTRLKLCPTCKDACKSFIMNSNINTYEHITLSSHAQCSRSMAMLCM